MIFLPFLPLCFAKLQDSLKKFAQLHLDKSKASSELTLTKISEYVNSIRKVLSQILEALDSVERHVPAKYGAFDPVEHK